MRHCHEFLENWSCITAHELGRYITSQTGIWTNCNDSPYTPTVQYTLLYFHFSIQMFGLDTTRAVQYFTVPWFYIIIFTRGG